MDVQSGQNQEPAIFRSISSSVKIHLQQVIFFKERGAKLASSTRPIVHRHCVSLYIGVIHQKITQKSQKSSQNNKNVSHECSYNIAL